MRTVLTTCLVLLACAVASRADDPTPKTPDARLKVQLFEPLAVEALAGNAGFFVGVGEFPNDDGVSSLSFATHDAIELAYLFSLELQLIPPKNCHLALGGEPTAEAVKGHLEQLRRAGAKITTADRSRILLTLRQVKGIAQDPSNLLICSFSSHGFQDRADPYVMPSDGVRDLLADTAVPLKTVETMLQDSKAGHRLLLVDACQERISAKAVGDDQLGQPVPKAFQEALAVPTGQAKFASCSPGEYSFEHGSLGGVGHGVFTWEFLAALRGKADVGADNIVRLGDVAKAVSMNVTAWSKTNRQRAQTPFLQSPVETLQLPLAIKADDLKTLLAELEQLPTGPLFTPELQRALIGHLEQSNPEDEADRKLLTATKDFAAGRLSPDFFVPYLERDHSRWGQADKDAGIALQFDGRRGEILLPKLSLTGQELTIEARVLPQGRLPEAGKEVVPIFQWGNSAVDISSHGDWYVLDLIHTDGSPQGVTDVNQNSGARWQKWTHVAVVMTAEKVTLFVDGVPSGSRDTASAMGDVATFWKQLQEGTGRLGGRKMGQDGTVRHWNGLISEFRISSTARYRTQFTPEDRLESDAATEVLYHIDEGEGDVLHDASGHRRDAAIAGANWVRPIVNSLGMRLMPIPAGDFLMGSPDTEASRNPDEGPQHRVIISDPFWLGAYEVTQADWEAVMGYNNCDFAPGGESAQLVQNLDTSTFPVERVTWFDAISFCNRLSAKEGLPPYYQLTWNDRGSTHIREGEVEVLGGDGYRLPTEAEWEFACRAGTTGRLYWSSTDLISLKAHANMLLLQGDGDTKRRISLGRPTNVSQYPANGYGLFDMLGNVHEWCYDAYDASIYAARQGLTTSPMVHDPAGGERCLRGGAFASGSDAVRSAARFHLPPEKILPNVGLRIARSASGTEVTKLRLSDGSHRDTGRKQNFTHTLKFDGPGLAHCDNQPVEPFERLTIECWARADGLPAASEYALAVDYANHGLVVVPSGKWQYSHSKSPQQFVHSDQPCELGRWTHLAGVWDGQRFMFFVDGKRQREGLRPEGDLRQQPYRVIIGGNANRDALAAGKVEFIYHRFPGQVGPVRVSRTARYVADFQPQRNWQPDAETIALYRFDEESGDAIINAAGNQLQLRLYGNVSRSEIESEAVDSQKPAE